MRGSVFVIIVNYRTPALAIDCIDSLVSQRGELHGGRVLVVDNHSGDDSVTRIAAEIEARGWADWVELLAMPRNGGFAYGNNAGLRRALALDAGLAAVVLLNPDAVAQPGALSQLLAYLDSNPGSGIAGAAIENAGGGAEGSAHRWPSPLGELAEAAQLGALSRVLRQYPVWPAVESAGNQCDWVSGACMAIRREVLDAVGPLDEGYFLYFEEVDFCLRARRAGWGSAFVPRAKVMHLEGAATGIRARRQRRPAYWYASRRRFFVKAYGVAGLVLADLLWALGRFSLVTRRRLGLGGRAGAAQEPTRYASDLLLGDLKAVVSGELRSIARIPRHAHAS